MSDVRAQLHRYCARMTGSQKLDGEDLVQGKTLFEAYTKIETLGDASSQAKTLVVSHRSQSLH